MNNVLSHIRLILSLVLVSLLTSGCDQHRIDKRMRNVSEGARYVRDSSLSQIMERATNVLDTITAKQLRSAPVMIGAWRIPHKNAETYVAIYWAEASPRVDSFRFTSKTMNASSVVQIPPEDNEGNMDMARHTVVFYSTLLWTEGETPVALKQTDCVVQLMYRGNLVSEPQEIYEWRSVSEERRSVHPNENGK